MERYKVLCYDASVYARGPARIEYKPGKWTSSPEWLAERGYYPLVFATFEDAWGYAKTLIDASGYIAEGIEIWKCAVRGKTPLQPVCNLGLLETKVLKEHFMDWPRGTEMWKQVKLIESVYGTY